MSAAEKFKLRFLKLRIIENEILLHKDRFFSGEADDLEKDLLISRAIYLFEQWNLHNDAIFDILHANPDQKSPARLELQKIEQDFRSKFPGLISKLFPESWSNYTEKKEVEYD
jgi:hypothetical protein